MYKNQLSIQQYLEHAEKAHFNGQTAQAESFFISALEQKNNNTNAIITVTTGYGNFLLDERRFIEAQRLLASIYQQYPTNIRIILAYYMSLRRQGLITECIQLCLTALDIYPHNNYLKSELAVAYAMSGNVQQALLLNETGFEATQRWKQWAISAYSSRKNNKKSFELIKKNIHSLEEDNISLQQAVQLSAQANPEQKLSEQYQQFLSLTDYNKRPVWAYFELLRYGRVNNDVALFEKKCETSFALDPVAYNPKITGESHVLFDKQEIATAKETFIQPLIIRDSLQENIKKFKQLCRELINDGVFKDFQDNIHRIKQHYAPNIPDFVQVMSTGRCGTLALYEFLKRSNQVIPYHTMQSQLIPPDRNHILYRILSGAFDKKIITTILTGYLQNRVSEICYAYTKQCTPVIINHWDTIFAPFLAELFPRSTFLHLWRADEDVFKSIYGKNQFQNEQLRHCWFDSQFLQGKFSCFFDGSLTAPQQIAWYLFFTREYALAFKGTLVSNRMNSIKSEDLFSGDINKFNILRSLMPISDINKEQFISSFSIPVNQKKDKVQIENNALCKQALHVKHIIDKLQRTGTL